MIDMGAIHAAAPSPLEVARRLGLEVARGAREDRCRVRCPVHADETPSCDIGLRGGRVVWVCRSCGEGGDLISLVAAVRGIDVRSDFGRAARETADLVGVRVDTGERIERRPRDRMVDLAHAIDRVGDDWLAGRPIVRSDVIETASPEDRQIAMSVVVELDCEIGAQMAELDAMADSVLASIARKEARWLTQ